MNQDDRTVARARGRGRCGAPADAARRRRGAQRRRASDAELIDRERVLL